jgi:D-alanine--poly(phosphoribitol) ligase subunit 2
VETEYGRIVEEKQMEELLKVLEDVTDEVDFTKEEHLIDDGLLTSFDILQIISALDDAYGISIPASEIVPKNFNSAKAMLALVNRLQQEG